jgi:hypothetical protein
MDYNSIFAEIFDGATSASASLGNPVDYRPAPAVPILDDPESLREFGKSGAANELCYALETENMIAQLVGPREDIAAPPATPKPAAPAPGSNALGEFIKHWSDRAPVPVAKAASRKRVIDGKLGPLYAPELRERWNRMLDKLANEPETDDTALLHKAVAFLGAA